MSIWLFDPNNPNHRFPETQDLGTKFPETSHLLSEEAPGSPELLVPTERPSPTSPGEKAEEALIGGGFLVVGYLCYLLIFVEHIIWQSVVDFCSPKAAKDSSLVVDTFGIEGRENSKVVKNQGASPM